MGDEKKVGSETLRELILEMSEEGVPDEVAEKYRKKYNLEESEKVSWKKMIARTMLREAASGDASAVKEVAKILSGIDESEVAAKVMGKLFEKVGEYVKLPETLGMVQEAFEAFYQEEYGEKE